jgi:hypothetical protein
MVLSFLKEKTKHKKYRNTPLHFFSFIFFCAFSQQERKKDKLKHEHFERMIRTQGLALQRELKMEM